MPRVWNVTHWAFKFRVQPTCQTAGLGWEERINQLTLANKLFSPRTQTNYITALYNKRNSARRRRFVSAQGKDSHSARGGPCVRWGPSSGSLPLAPPPSLSPPPASVQWGNNESGLRDVLQEKRPLLRTLRTSCESKRKWGRVGVGCTSARNDPWLLLLSLESALTNPSARDVSAQDFPRGHYGTAGLGERHGVCTHY